MKFLSNFDTALEAQIVKNYIELYGKENVLAIHRAKIFWMFHCVFPTIAILGLLISIWLIVWWDSGDSTFDVLKSLLGFVLGAVIIFVWGGKVLKRYLDYKMDFCVVTPQEIVSYNQTGILNRNSRTIDADKIKTVSADGSGMIKSLFNYGDITFLSEGDQSGGGDIRLNFVADVNGTKNRVRDLIEPHLQKHTIKHETS